MRSSLSIKLEETCVYAVKMSILDLIIIAHIKEEEEAEDIRRERFKRNFWVHDVWKKRHLFGQFRTFCTNLHLYPSIYYDYYKMNYYKFESLLEILRPHIQKQNTNYRLAIPAEERLSVCLRFLTTAISFKALAHEYHMGYSTVLQIVHETCSAIWKYLRPRVMPKPTAELWTKLAKEFETQWNFPNCIGAIDGKHVNIRAPWNSGSQFYNYKKFFSVVLLAIADANYRFVVVDIGAYGRNSDSGILSSSRLGQSLNNNTLDIPPIKCLPGTTEALPHVFVGDEAFPLHKHIMRPFPGNQEMMKYLKT
ncbi:uncharacterized protein LOC118277359 [Spodoptera frugiperda]|uniref:Uncharacterized protein LOC118277359 n=1 Tax=Spodoptera frugiperda TaxID=7108 RepID=A0A9R0DS91_SPOFR|nr:uncharacterized protein LOC118277359 [Spodoptera frugiperda]